MPPASGEGAAPLELPEVSQGATTAGGLTTGRLVVVGSTRPIKEANLSPRGNGVLASVAVDEGDLVKKGQILFRLDGAVQSLAVAQADAGISSATVQVDAAERDMARTEQLFKQGAISQAAYDQMQARLDGATAAAAQAKAARSSAARVAYDTTVRSPIDGLVVRKHKNVGEAVTLMPPTVVLEIQDISQLEVRANIPERSLAIVDIGSRVAIRFQSGEERQAKVDRISGKVDERTRTVEIVSILPNEDGKLKAGMLAKIDFGVDAQPALAADTAASARSGAAAESKTKASE